MANILYCNIPFSSFYFIRHGQTNWNKSRQELCNQDNISLNETGLPQAINVCKHLDSLGITKIYASPLARAKETAEIVSKYLDVPIDFHEGLRKISDEDIFLTCKAILMPEHTTLIVSHGEVYRILLRILDAQATDLNAQNGGLYFFQSPDLQSDRWVVLRLSC